MRGAFVHCNYWLGSMAMANWKLEKKLLTLQTYCLRACLSYRYQYSEGMEKWGGLSIGWKVVVGCVGWESWRSMMLMKMKNASVFHWGQIQYPGLLYPSSVCSLSFPTFTLLTQSHPHPKAIPPISTICEPAHHRQQDLFAFTSPLIFSSPLYVFTHARHAVRWNDLAPKQS